jgi:hypothetical protein
MEKKKKEDVKIMVNEEEEVERDGEERAGEGVEDTESSNGTKLGSVSSGVVHPTATRPAFANGR